MRRKIFRKLYNKISKNVLIAKSIRHIEPSLIFSPDDISPNNFLIDLMVESIPLAWRSPISAVNSKLPDSKYLNIFPGEHYRIIKAITRVMNPKLVVEVGTYTGMGSIAILEGLDNGILYTNDIINWNKFETHLRKKDFHENKIIQIISDFSNANEFENNIQILNQAEIIFVDAPKDGVFEYKFLSLLTKLDQMDRKLLILDDIRFINMIDLWLNIASPKMDVSSFGHWSGTGIVDISNGLKLK